MSRASRQRKNEAALKSLEDHFMTDLVSELRRCAAGSWGIFGQNDHVVAQQPVLQLVYKGAAAKLIEHGDAIVELRKTLGFSDPFPPLSRFLEYRQMRGSNVPGEPKLAARFLKELGVE